MNLRPYGPCLLMVQNSSSAVQKRNIFWETIYQKSWWVISINFDWRCRKTSYSQRKTAQIVSNVQKMEWLWPTCGQKWPDWCSDQTCKSLLFISNIDWPWDTFFKKLVLTIKNRPWKIQIQKFRKSKDFDVNSINLIIKNKWPLIGLFK